MKLKALCFTLPLAIGLNAQEPAFKWGNVAMGGGGFISSILASPLEENLFYARTDVGGAYRWEESSQTWVSMMDWVDADERGLLGIEALAIDPQTPGTVYMTAGTVYWNQAEDGIGRSAFLKSTNYGKTWEKFYTWDNEKKLFNVHGNGMGRGNGEALSVDPTNSQNLFYGSKNQGLWASKDNGKNWTKVDGFTSAAGADTTWNGAGFSFVKYAPGNSDVLFAGFLREGTTQNQSFENVFMSEDGGTSWQALAIPDSLRMTAGGGLVRLMPQRLVVAKENAFIAVTFSDGAGPHTQAWAESWGNIYDGFGRGAVLKYDLQTKTWSDISPEDYIDGGETGPSTFDSLNVAGLSEDETSYAYIAPYGGIDINPENPLEMIVTTEGYMGPQFWYDALNESWSDQWGSNLFRTTDGGVTWVPTFKYYWMEGGVFPEVQQMDANGVGWMYNGSIHWSGSIALDPFNPERAFVSSGNGIFRTDNLTDYTYAPAECDWCEDQISQRQVWKFSAHGVEETVPEEVVSIPGGPLISVIADYDGFRHDHIRDFPGFRHSTDVGGANSPLGSTRGLAWAPKAGVLVKVSDARVYQGQYNDIPISPLQFSSDTGKTWQTQSYIALDASYKSGTVSISADGAVALWTPREGTDVVHRYANSNWGEVTGIEGAYTVGDPENENVFYAYIRGTGEFFKSTDKGLSFAKISTPGVSSFKKFRAIPNREGHLWLPVATSEGGVKSGALLRSTDGGATFNPVPEVGYCEAVGYGKAAEGSDYPSIYVFAEIGGVLGVFQSTDEGQTWLRVNDDAHEYGGLANGEFVMGDMNAFGVVYMSTAGRGIAARYPTTWDQREEVTRKEGPSAEFVKETSLHSGSLNLKEKTRVQVFSMKGEKLVDQFLAEGSHNLVEHFHLPAGRTLWIRMESKQGIHSFKFLTGVI